MPARQAVHLRGVQVTTEWRSVVGFEGRYEVSSGGEVRTVARFIRTRWEKGAFRAARVLRQEIDKDGYRRVALSDGERKRHRLVHVIVLQAFVGPKPGPRFVTRHLDGVRHNNSPGNLAWGTQRENCADKARHGTHQIGSTHPRSKINEDTAKHVKSLLAQGLKLRQAAAVAGVSFWVAADISRGRTWGHVSCC